MRGRVREKKPWLGALLNVIPGLGYVYSERLVLGVGWIIAFVLLATSSFSVDYSNPIEWGAFLSLVVVWILLVYDGYVSTKEANR